MTAKHWRYTKMETPRFEDLKELFRPDVDTHHQDCMDSYFDQLGAALPTQALKDMLRQFDSYWILKAEALADAAFLYGYLTGRRMTGDLAGGSGTTEDQEGTE